MCGKFSFLYVDMQIFSLMCQRVGIFVYIKIAVQDLGYVFPYSCGRQKNKT